ncbi:MAG: tripartite tricarboxylate transporter TctB family protein [Rhodobacteraceae bacterium]|nr:tripartite tricarboxylate transporter TctB family protein [Paracoccaceae bacterium]
MGRLTKSHIIETVVWGLIVIIFFGFSFEFDREIEIYKFGATGWPRTILVLLALVTLGNLFHLYSNGSIGDAGRVGQLETDEEMTYNSLRDYSKLLAILIGPLIYAILLKPVGFYFLTPFFISYIIVIFGERRLKFILGFTLLLYLILLLLFVVVLNAPLPQGNMSPFYDYSAFLLKLNTQLKQLSIW